MTSQLASPFSARAVQPASVGGGNSLPVGKHPVVIVGAEIIASNNNQQNGMAVFDLEVIDGPAKGTDGKYRLNLYHSDPKVASIAQRQLSSLCHVVGVYDVQDLMQLAKRPFVVDVQLDVKNQEQYPGSTQIKGVLDMALNDPGKAGSGQAQPQPAAATAPAPVTYAAPAQPAAAPAPAWGGGAPAQAVAPAPAAAAPAPWQPAAGAAPAGNAPPWQR